MNTRISAQPQPPPYSSLSWCPLSTPTSRTPSPPSRKDGDPHHSSSPVDGYLSPLSQWLTLPLLSKERRWGLALTAGIACAGRGPDTKGWATRRTVEGHTPLANGSACNGEHCCEEPPDSHAAGRQRWRFQQ